MWLRHRRRPHLVLPRRYRLRPRACGGQHRHPGGYAQGRSPFQGRGADRCDGGPRAVQPRRGGAAEAAVGRAPRPLRPQRRHTLAADERVCAVFDAPLSLQPAAAHPHAASFDEQPALSFPARQFIQARKVRVLVPLAEDDAAPDRQPRPRLCRDARGLLRRRRRSSSRRSSRSNSRSKLCPTRDCRSCCFLPSRNALDCGVLLVDDDATRVVDDGLFAGRGDRARPKCARVRRPRAEERRAGPRPPVVRLPPPGGRVGPDRRLVTRAGEPARAGRPRKGGRCRRLCHGQAGVDERGG
mmetsp:Transcript_2047/g.6815  ORF Transcript_2047/g.6815 Transcript_2047/m.6815 type:complete len:298 (-) Transcript_2047:690-1583(-)